MAYEIVYSAPTANSDLSACVKELQSLLGSRVSADEGERLLVGKDFWPIAGNWLLQGRVPSLPDLVVWPENSDEVCQIIEIASRYRVPVIPFGEGSGVLGGVCAVSGGIVVDMKRMNHIIELDEKSLLLTVETGINGQSLERSLNERGYTLRHIPQSIRCSTVGGWVACRAAGQFSTKYGKIEDMIVGLQAVLPDGSLYENTIAPRTATGPRLDQLFLGAEGLLGIVTRAVLRIWPLPPESIGRSYAFASVDEALEAVRRILQNNIRPAVVRIYDQSETSHHFKNIAAAEGKCMLILVMEGIAELVAVENQVSERECLSEGGVDCGSEPVEHWFATRFNVSLSSTLIQHGAVVDTIEISAVWRVITPLYHQLMENLKAVPGTFLAGGHFSHVYTDGACLYMTVIGMPPGSPDDYYRQIWDTAMITTHRGGGTISHHHGVGLNRARFMEMEHGTAGMKLLAQVKQAVDPVGIMNPGKMGLGVSLNG
ncbi:MAG: FAD-binding oxidoreductase [Methylocystaceae bacterium]